MSRDPNHAFQRLLITQVALILIYPLIAEYRGANFLLGVFLVLALYGGVSVTLKRPLIMWIAIVLGVIFVGSYWLSAAIDTRELRVWSGAWGAAFFWFVALVIMKHIFFERSRVNMDLIYGAISVYLLIGSGFGELFQSFALADPNTFNGIEITGDYDKVARSMSYYSFVTLTTLGYGDITPAVHYAKVLAYVEAIIGQLYLTILVARLVGTYIAQSQQK